MIFSKNKSMVCFFPNAAARVRLVCFPCAGGGASMYRRWSQLIPDAEVWGVNYPGRETLHGQPFAASSDQIVDLITADPAPWQGKPVLLYGHSFGAYMAFATALQLQQAGIPVTAVLASARRAPHLPALEDFSDLSDDEFLAEIDRFGGVPAAVRQDPDVMAFYAPIIRADLHLNDRSQTAEQDLIQAPIHLFSGSYDLAASAEELQAWRSRTRGHFAHREFVGGHFFIQDDPEGFTACLRGIMQSVGQEDDEDLVAY